MRKIANYTVTDEGDDKGKVFLITKMSAFRIESWSLRAILALMRAGVEVPENFEELGAAGLAELGLKSLSRLDWVIAEPLLVEMTDCIQFIPDSKKTHVVRPLTESDIEEVPTILKLRVEWWKLHMDFLLAVAPSLLGANQGAAALGRKPRIKT